LIFLIERFKYIAQLASAKRLKRGKGLKVKGSCFDKKENTKKNN